MNYTSTSFHVFQFTLRIGPDGRPTQDRKKLGGFSAVEEAFAVANIAAKEALARVQQQCADPTSSEATIIDTEWGYDLRKAGLVIERFWVHDRASAIIG